MSSDEKLVPISGVAADAVLRRPPALGLSHLVVLLVFWFPLNPIVLSLLRSPANVHDRVHVWGMLATTICGPWTAALEGRNRESCLEFATRAFPICGGAIGVALVVQFLWRPRGRIGQVMRSMIWSGGWFIWFAGAFVSILNNSG